MANNQPIGIFDSGIGGTSIWREIHELLPNEGTIYLADSKNAPYGEKSPEEIIKLSADKTEFLLAQKAKLIVVACNTATTNAISYLRAHYSVPFVGIEPAIKPAALQSKTAVIGVLATKGTINSELFHEAVKRHANVRIIEQIGYCLVKLIESGQMNSPEMNTLLRSYVEPMVKEGIDALVLGCTHYPYLIPQLREILPSHIQIIDSGEAVARQTKRLLEQNVGFSNEDKPKLNFYTNAEPTVMQGLLPSKCLVTHLDF